MVVQHNKAIASLIRQRYTIDEIRALRNLLEARGTLSLAPLPNGLFPARNVQPGSAVGGYQYVWVRDNVYIAHCLYLNNEIQAALRNIQSLASYFCKYSHRFSDVIANPTLANDAMLRPRVRFDGLELQELVETWPHAQNDALGYFLWLFCRFAKDKVLKLDNEQVELLGSFVKYFGAIRFWQDEDSGHWEEERKINASSIGVVLGALQELQRLLVGDSNIASGFWTNRIKVDTVTQLITLGREALNQILPAECIQADRARDCDAALLFIIYPMEIVDHRMADRIITQVVNTLLGDNGIRRYLGDSYWCGDYKDLFSPEERTGDFSNKLAWRNSFLKDGEEAQWCIFDPVLSSIYAKRYQRTGDEIYLESQIAYLNRSLAQVTSDFKCPEAYYLEHRRYVANDNTPLHWAQANLSVALRHAEDSIALSNR